MPILRPSGYHVSARCVQVVQERREDSAGPCGKPAKHNVSAGEQVIAMTSKFVAILGPSAWILAHLQDYKKRE